jgi:hydroxymethylpyrimidine kinase/phosphomethylpyrimidine kinase/thiamine-phosphate diphosphorylase
MVNNNQLKKPPVVWSIANSDSGGGTGIQADLHTFHDFDVYGCTVITAVSAQNSFTQGYVAATERKSVVAQINALDSDMPAKAIKIGMLPNREIMETVIKYLVDYTGLVVYDVELQSSGEWLKDEADLLKTGLLPLVDFLVVNTEEVSLLTGIVVDSSATMMTAMESLLALGARAVLITGARLSPLPTERFDYWSDGDQNLWVAIEAVDTANNRGGGSTLSAAITACLAQQQNIETALKNAKAYVTQGIRHANQIGGGPGSVAHLGAPKNDQDWPRITATLN